MAVLAELKRNERKEGRERGVCSTERRGGMLLDLDGGGTLLGHSVRCVVFTTLTAIPGVFCFECQKLPLANPWPLSEWLKKRQC